MVLDDPQYSQRVTGLARASCRSPTVGASLEVYSWASTMVLCYTCVEQDNVTQMNAAAVHSQKLLNSANTSY
jgi:hypothetical protein